MKKTDSPFTSVHVSEELTAEQYQDFVKQGGKSKPYLTPKQREEAGEVVAKERKPYNNQEHRMQEACVRWFRAQYGIYAKLLYCNANEGGKGVNGKARARIGVVSGIPDITLAVARGGYHGSYFELKCLPNKPTDNQNEMMNLLRQQGYFVTVVFTIEQFIEVINEYMSLSH